MIAYTSSCKKFSTPILNRFLHDIQTSHQPPIVKGIRPKLKFAHQGGRNPPNIIIHGNHLWISCMEMVYANRVWKSCVEILHGHLVWTSCMEMLFVNHVLKFCMDICW